MKKYKIFFTVLLLIMPLISYATVEPIAMIRSNADEIISIMADANLTQDEKVNKLSTIAEDNFSFEEMARRTLAIHWKKRTKDEKVVFTYTYKEFLKHTYAGNINKYSGEKVTVLSQKIEDDYAIVKTLVINEKLKRETPVNYKLKLINNEWKVYDIVVEGISLINNYREQFNEIINGSSFDGLLKLLDKKIKEAKHTQTTENNSTKL